MFVDDGRAPAPPAAAGVPPELVAAAAAYVRSGGRVVPELLVDSVSCEAMHAPISNCYGHTYNAPTYRRCLQRRAVDPNTAQPLRHPHVAPNYRLLGHYDVFRAQVGRLDAALAARLPAPMGTAELAPLMAEIEALGGGAGAPPRPAPGPVGPVEAASLHPARAGGGAAAAPPGDAMAAGPRASRRPLEPAALNAVAPHAAPRGAAAARAPRRGDGARGGGADVDEAALGTAAPLGSAGRRRGRPRRGHAAGVAGRGHGMSTPPPAGPPAAGPSAADAPPVTALDAPWTSAVDVLRPPVGAQLVALYLSNLSFFVVALGEHEAEAPLRATALAVLERRRRPHDLCAPLAEHPALRLQLAHIWAALGAAAQGRAAAAAFSRPPVDEVRLALVVALADGLDGAGHRRSAVAIQARLLALVAAWPEIFRPPAGRG